MNAPERKHRPIHVSKAQPRPLLEVPERQAQVFDRALTAIEESRVPFSVGGYFAMHFYAGVLRSVKDFDVHVVPSDVDRVLTALVRAGFTTRMRHPEWLAQAYLKDCQVDVVFGMGNWIAAVDEDWIRRGSPGNVLDHDVVFAPPEEIIWSKAYMCSRERYDGGDVFQLLVTVGDRIDWHHLVARFGNDWEVLLSQLLMFRYVFPSHRDVVPDAVLDQLLAKLNRTRRQPWTGGMLCRGTLLDGSGTYQQYVTERGYRDARQDVWERRQRIERAAS